MELTFNKCQTPITMEELDSYPQEVKELFLDFITNIPYIKYMIDKDRPYAKDLPKDEEGKIIIDLTKPHILENTDYFRPTALHYKKYGCFTKLRPNANPNSEYGKWLREEVRRCWEGYIRPSDGEWIPGDMYFFLNYCPIQLIKESSKNTTIRTIDFPSFFDGAYYRFHYLNQCRKEGHHAMELAKRGAGKAHPYDEYVWTPEGLKQWKDIKIGDYLFGDEGDITKVVDIPFDDVAPIYELELANGSYIQCSEGHLWRVLHCKEGELIVTTKELLSIYKRPKKIARNNSIGYKSECSIPVSEGVEFKHVDTKINPYALGLLLGNDKLRVAIGENKIYFTGSYDDFAIYKNHIPYDYVRYGNPNLGYCISIPNLKDILNEYTLSLDDPKTKFIPKEYLYNSKDVRLNILKGLLDSSGDVNKKRIEIAVSSKQLIEDIKWLCASLGINYTKERVKSILGVYELSIFSNIPLFNIPWKYKIWKNRLINKVTYSKYKGSLIANIRYVGKKKAKCVTVDNYSHCYLINNFIVTHNSYSAAALLAKRFILGESNEVKKKVQCVATAAERKYIQGANLLLDMFLYYIDFCADNTEFPAQRLTSSLQNMQWTMGYLDIDSGTRKGTLNSVMGITSKDDESKLRGSRGVLYLLEEAGCHIKGTECYKVDKTVEKVENIKVGDYLLGPDMKPREVLKVFTGTRKLYKITLSNGDSLIVTNNHPVYVKVRTWGKSAKEEFKTFTCEELLHRDYKIGHYIVKLPISYNHRDVLIDPYMLGLWLGGGDSSRISFVVVEEKIKEYFNSFGNKCYLRHLHSPDKCDIVYFPKSLNQDLYNAFNKYGLIKNKYIPEEYKHNSKDIMLNLLAGIIDSDGYYDSRRHIYEIVQHSSRRDIIYDLKEIAEDLGMRCTITTKIGGKKSLKPGELYYRLFLRSNIEIPVKVERKRLKSRSNYKNKLNWNEYSFTIEYYGEGEYYGFLIDKDHLFLLKDRTIVHNSFPRLLNLYQVLRPSVEDGNRVFGLIYGYGCCCAGTKVIKENGEPINIEEVELNDKLLGYNGLKSTIENISWKQPIGYKECVRITTEKNNSLECSIDHPILALNKDRFGRSLGSCSFYEAKELKVGNTLLMPRKIGTFGHIHEDNAFLLGALFGDGNYSNNSCVSLSISTEEEYKFYNTNYNIGISKFSKGNNTYALIYFKGLHPLLKKYKMDKLSFSQKILPYNIFDWDKESLCQFLGGYFNADGNIQIVKKKHRSIKLTCKYNKILTLIKYLLLKLGISSHIYKEKKQSRILHSNVNNKDYVMSNSECYVLYISNSKDILLFKNNIKLLIKAKLERLDSYNLHYKKGLAENLKFLLRDNNKGVLLSGKTFNDLLCVTIKNIENTGIKEVYNMTADTTHTYISNGFISSNTSGDNDSDFSSMQELMYNPDGYNIKGVPNVYDKEGQGRLKFTYFYPGYLNRANCYDENGNSDVIKALLEILKDRYTVKYNSTNVNAITKRIAEIPITPQEAILRTRGNVFPITEIAQRLNEIDNNPNFYDDTYVGTLVFNGLGKVEFSIGNRERAIREFPTDNNKVEGALEIYEMPLKVNDKVPNERYIASLDNYENDESNTMSLGSMFVLDLWTDRIVAEYTGRPLFVDDLNELARKLCLFYNAKLLFENNKKNTFAYFSKMNSLHLLADTPEYLKNKLIIKNVGYGNTSKGVTATLPVKNFGFTLIRDWLLKPVTVIKEEGQEIVTYTVPNLHFIKNRALLKELMLYNPDINVDRIMSLVQLMLFREEKMILYRGDPAKNTKTEDFGYLGNDPFFKANYNFKLLQ